VILLLVVYVTPLHTIALHYLLSVHLLQNVVTAEWAPGLVVFALAPALARELERSAAVRFVTHPLVALPVWLGTYFLWHVPPIYDKALEQSGWLLNLEHLTYFLAGVLMWWPVVHGRYSDGVKALYLFGAFVLAAPLGLLLALLPRPIYDFYKDAPQLWGLSDETDQQIAGVTMAVEQAIVFFAVFAYFFMRFLRTEHIAGVFSESSR
jgi:putative membrane protein